MFLLLWAAQALLWPRPFHGDPSPLFLLGLLDVALCCVLPLVMGLRWRGRAAEQMAMSLWLVIAAETMLMVFMACGWLGLWAVVVMIPDVTTNLAVVLLVGGLIRVISAARSRRVHHEEGYLRGVGS